MSRRRPVRSASWVIFTASSAWCWSCLLGTWSSRKWDHLASRLRVKVDPKSFAYPMEVSADVLRREQLAVQARDAAGVSEFRVTGSIRTAWYEAQRRDPSLAAALKKPEAPMVLAADGLALVPRYEVRQCMLATHFH